MPRCFLALIGLLSGILLGCHKKEAAAPAEPAPAPAAAPGAPASPPATVSVPQGPPPGAKPLPAAPPHVAARADNYVRQNITGEVDSFLTGQLQTFIQQKHRFPDSFAEFALLRLDSIPRPPEGKRWVIDSATLQVKAVPAK